MNQEVRVRFAPSPTGGLHLGGVRTALFNYLFAKQNNGKFIIRIEDTDQTRFVAGAEEYIMNTLAWCGITADESVQQPGNYGPYKQSERKELYANYAQKLVENGNAYYAFDTAEELDAKRKEITNFQYNAETRLHLRNSLTLSKEVTQQLLNDKEPHVIRILLPQNEVISFNDMIRGEVAFNTNIIDDKVLLKADGMPTYHLAVVVDDYLMKISHVFRGEEWLPSAPVHILLWKYLFGEIHMPQWAHLPLILKPDGHGKLSKRDGERLGFPVFAMDWTDPRTNEKATGFKEMGFIPEAFINMLAMLGWNDGTGKEIFSLSELINSFDVKRIHKGGAKFDYEKAKWYNHEWIKNSSADSLLPKVTELFAINRVDANAHNLLQAIDMVKERCTFVNDFLPQAAFLFQFPATIEINTIQQKWDATQSVFFEKILNAFEENTSPWDAINIEQIFKQVATELSVKPAQLMLPLRIMLVGGKFGPGVFDIAAFIGKQETCNRIKHCISLLQQQ